MAFTNKNLSVIAYANGFTLWHYASSEKLSVICADDYFASLKNLMNAGDMIIVSASDSAAIRRVISTSPNVRVAVLG